MFEDVHSKIFIRVNNFLALVTIISVLSITLESVKVLESYTYIFNLVEWISVFFFTLEYIGRLIVSKKKLYYAGSFFGLIDLISIVPTYFALGNLTFLKTTRILRVLRFLKIIRVSKLSGGEPGREELGRLNFKIYAMSLIASIVIFGSLIFIAEGHRPDFANIPLGMIWAAKILLGGTPEVLSETIRGELVTIAGRFTGLILFGLLINVVGGAFNKLLFGSKKV